jgi:hypothetical protein
MMTDIEGDDGDGMIAVTPQEGLRWASSLLLACGPWWHAAAFVRFFIAWREAARETDAGLPRRARSDEV